jgi:phosphomannomutase / phosphoglucomutase
MSNQKKLFGTNGIRGLVNEELTPEMAVKVGLAIGTFFKKGTIIIGYDARTSGPMLAKAVISGLTATGCNVLLVGMAPTPTIQYTVKQHKPAGGVIITASHNPPEYNGIKVLWKDGVEISQEQETEIENIYFQNKAKLAQWNELGELQDLPGVIDEYIKAVQTHVDVPSIRKRNYHIVVDPANSVGALANPKMLREMGCRVTTINANIDGTFPGRLPEPRPENLKDLALTVKAVNADLGVAFDGDADRAIFVDEKGQIHMGDQTFALVEKYYLKEHPNEQIVTPVSSSTLIKDIADAHKGKIVWTKVGSVTVAQTMKQLRAKLGGEENGGIFYGPHQPVRDGAMSTALILQIMAKTGKKLSTLIEELPTYFLEKGKIDCEEKLKEKVLKELLKELAGSNVNTIDGAKIWLGENGSILIRPSGTEPIYRLYAEAKTAQKAKKLVTVYTQKLKKIISSLSR